tara:strand:+ start:1753 stop:1920 length:168 start_codon:yes stop_codon:yes gene_type:complete
MDVNKLLILAAIDLLLAFFTAFYFKNRGYTFWKTFVMSTIGYLGLELTLIKILWP